ncbi:hypothetical protein [Streptomyces sp. NPDC046821]|uniref:hypothetical protein n=1 Tax=Streptomyces sp. NPDC046821 TaxID=3154702 RepID=UPI0033D9F2AD
MRRWIKVAVTAAAVLGLGGYIAEPYARDWMAVGSACDGALPRDAVEQLRPESAQFTGGESQRIPGLGFYRCSLSFQGEQRWDVPLIGLAAYTGHDDQDRDLMTAFPDMHLSSHMVLSGGLPGIVDDLGVVRIVMPCPALGKDDEGRPRKMLVRFEPGEAWKRESEAVHRTAVSLANSASGKLGCGARPLSAPQKTASLDWKKRQRSAVPVERAAGTGCDWLARAGLARETGWRVMAEVNDSAPANSCELRGKETASGREPAMVFSAWYGDWGNRLTADDGNGERLPLTAVARCDGEAANFRIDAAKNTPGLAEADRPRLLKMFAEDQVRRRGCSGLRLY